jgi:hypothetical protein
MLVTATDSRITFEFYSIENGGRLIDSFTIEHQAASAPSLSARLDSAGDKVVISWPANSGEFELRETADLVHGQWERVSIQQIEADGVRSVSIPIGKSRSFYQLRR